MKLFITVIISVFVIGVARILCGLVSKNICKNIAEFSDGIFWGKNNLLRSIASPQTPVMI